MSLTFAEIKLSNLNKNIEYLKNTIGKNVEILAVVKADAYGHGSVEISKALIAKGVNYLAVASYEEALELKSAGIESKILILSSITNEEMIESIKSNISFTIFDFSQLDFINSLKEGRIGFHLKIDTGMNRLGISTNEIKESINIIKNNPALLLEGVYTHLPEADVTNSSFTLNQINKFENMVSLFKESIPDVGFFHIANSSAVINFVSSHINMVRPGILLYGLSKDAIPNDTSPVMTLKSSLIKIRTISAGDSVSYGRTFIAEKEMIIGVIPIGYADGLPRSLSNIGYVLHNNKKCKIIGRVCMDLTMIDLTEVINPKIGDEVVLFGENLITAKDIALLSETIPYEIICGISKRVKRVYI